MFNIHKICVALFVSLFTVLFVLIGGVSISHAGPYDHCGQILAGGQFNQSLNYSNSSVRQSMKTWMCQQSSESKGKNANLEAAWNRVVDKRSGSFSYGKFKQWKQHTCQSHDSSYNASAQAFHYLQIMDAKVVEAWKSCVAKQNKGLVCYAKPFGPEHITVKIFAAKGLSNGYRTKIRRPDLINIKKVSTSKHNIGEGEEVWTVVSRKDVNKSSFVHITGKARGNRTKSSCGLTIPPSRKEETTQPLPKQSYVIKSSQEQMSWMYSIKLNNPIILKKLYITIDGDKFNTPTPKSELLSNHLTGSIRIYPDSAAVSEALRQEWYWQAQKQGCNHLSCNTAYITRKRKDLERKVKKTNERKRRFHRYSKKAIVEVIDIENNKYVFDLDIK